MERRLDYGAVRDPEKLSAIGGVVPMVLAIFDVDAAESHKALGGSGDIPASDEWWIGELEKVQALRAAHPDLFIYRTRGGYRIVGALAEPFEIRSQEDADRWTGLYLQWVCYLRRCFSIVADAGCKEWNRLYRLPRATRDGSGRPERRETIGSPSAIGVWTPDITPADRDAATLLGQRKATKRKRREATGGGYTGPGILHHVFSAKGWLGPEIEPGKWAAKCPREHEHSKGSEFDTSTILVAPGDGEAFGLLHCSHSNSGHDRYTLRDWIACLDQAEIDAAREALGIPKYAPEQDASKEADDERPAIEVESARLTEIVDQAIVELAKRDVFQRGGQLVDVVRSAEVNADRIVRPEGAQRIRLLPHARLREELNRATKFLAWKMTFGELKLVPVSPPADIVATLAARGEWAHIRPLDSIVDWPVLRPDGSVFTGPGYDAPSRTLSACDLEIDIPEKPTQDDARRAIADLVGVVADFPFADTASKAAWVAWLMTPVARPAIDGPTPLLLIDANNRGTGKTLAADAGGTIVLGRGLPRRTAPDDPAEWKKAMLGIAVAGDPILLIDNVTRQLRSDALDTVLTGGEFRERVLGKNEDLVLPIRTVFVVTSNNATVSADLVRRSLHCRLESADERPEQRQSFKHFPLLPWIRENRARLLGAILTVLRAYQCAGRPTVELRPMGSYEAWSAIVRAAVVWAGMPDPAITQDALRENADLEHEVVSTLLPAWHAVHGERPLTARTVLAELDRTPEEIKQGDALSPDEERLKDAIGVLCDAEAGKLPNTRKLGNRLRTLRGVVKGDLVFERAGDERGESGYSWRVRQRAAVSAESSVSGLQPSRAREETGTPNGGNGDGYGGVGSETDTGDAVHTGREEPPSNVLAFPEPSERSEPPEWTPEHEERWSSIPYGQRPTRAAWLSAAGGAR